MFPESDDYVVAMQEERGKNTLTIQEPWDFMFDACSTKL